ncbi:MAG: TonB-dependent receptor [Sedimentisphaerales bacterium]|nr:TonB-dependent receptor [Sedimentisphaerales bacterium]
MAAVQSLNPDVDVSAVLDTYWQTDDVKGTASSLIEAIDGFACAHAHEHHQVEGGFNMRHMEISLSAYVDPYFKGTAIAAILEHGAEMEVAQMEALGLPYGLGLKAGKFFSDMGYLNPKHSHEWDFVDQPLVYRLLLGEHGLNEIGAQVSWLAPTPFYMLFGMEALQGKNEQSFSYIGGDPLPVRDGPRFCVGWLKVAPTLGIAHTLQLGGSVAIGRHQEAHDGDADGDPDHWLDGQSALFGLDLVYKQDSALPYGQGDLTIQAEYLYRNKQMRIVDHLLDPGLVGRYKIDRQDGYYLQATYGLAPRWRCGFRWDQVGLTNTTRIQGSIEHGFGSSWRISAMCDFSPSEFSRLRFQLSKGRYLADDVAQDVVEFIVQLQVSIGAHGAHAF